MICLKQPFTVSGSILKVNYAPYIIEIVLNGHVDQSKKKASVKNGNLCIVLHKESPGIWGQLEATGDKETITAIKQESIRANDALNEELTTKRSDRRLAEEKHSLRKQMGLDEAERTRLENIKQDEKEAAEKEVYEAFNQLQRKQAVPTTADKPKKTISFAAATTPSPSPASTSTSTRTTATNNNKDIFPDSSSDLDSILGNDNIEDDIADYVYVDEESAPQKEEEDDNNFDITQQRQPSHSATDSNNDIFAQHDQYEEVEEEVRYVPPPRQLVRTGADGAIEAGAPVVGIQFTPRVFPTPMRESKVWD